MFFQIWSMNINHGVGYVFSKRLLFGHAHSGNRHLHLASLVLTSSWRLLADCVQCDRVVSGHNDAAALALARRDISTPGVGPFKRLSRAVKTSGGHLKRCPLPEDESCPQGQEKDFSVAEQHE